MTIESEISGLTQATTDLLQAVNIRKAELDQRVADAASQAELASSNGAAQVALAAQQVVLAATQAGNAANSAGEASARATASDASAIQSASSATKSANSATQAAASAASASQIVLGVASGLPNVLPSLNLDFSNSKTVDPRITFSRASAATFYDGKTTAKAEENLLLGSQDFSNTYWSYQLSTSYALNTQTAPDGSITADTVTFAGISTSDTVYQNISANSVNGDIYTASVWLRAAAPVTVNLIIERLGPADTVIQTCNVTTTWTRFSLTHTGVFSGSSAVRFKLSTPSAIGDIYVWGAQLEKRSSFTAYTPTTTQPITNYIPALQTAAAGVPRIDHDPITGECKGLLIEEQRTNLLTYSEQLDNAAWTKSNLSVQANVVVAPDGTLTGDKLVENTTTNNHFVRQDPPVVAGDYTFSFYAKAAGRSLVFATLDGGSNTKWFDLTTGMAGGGGSGTAAITNVGNGWYRCAYTFTRTAGTAPCLIFVSNSTSIISYAGDGYSGIYIWGAQLEAGAFPTSYIKTEASQVTRSADSASITGSNFSRWYRQDEGTLFAEAVSPGNSDWPCVVSACRSDYSLNSIQLQFYTGGTSQAGFEVNAGGAAQAGPWGSVTNRAVFAKLVGAYKLNDIAYSNNGAAVITDGSALIPSVEILRIGNSYSNTKPLNGHIKKLAYYPKRLSNSELQALTA